MVVGQDEVIDQLLICALTGSHALLVGVPGLAKTLMVKALASAFHWKFSRIQFTPDLMPADVTGYELLGRGDDSQGPKMVFRPGPVFANLVLADEINRAAPKTQSALLEAMAEQHVTVGGQTYLLEEPFLVAATQNPIEQEGTYPLPEAQLDRFMMEIRIGYPSPEQEEEIVMRTTCGRAASCRRRRLTREEFLQLRDLVLAVPVAPNVAAYAVRLCGASRPDDPRAPQFVRDYVAWGAGPRGSQNLVLAAKARALLVGRCAPSVEDVRAVALPILRHRIIVNHRAVGDGVDLGRRSSLASCSEEVAPHEHADAQPVPRSAGAGGAGAHAVHHAASHRRLLQRLPHRRGSKAGRASSSISANTPAARTSGGWIGKCWAAPARPSSASTRKRPTCSARWPWTPAARWSSAAGRDGRGSKLEYVQYLATALAHVISRGQDQVGLAVLDERLRERAAARLDRLAPGDALRHDRRRWSRGPRRRWPPALRELFERSRRRGVLLLMSDFLMEDLEEVFAALRLFRHRGWEVVVAAPGPSRRGAAARRARPSASRAWKTTAACCARRPRSARPIASVSPPTWPWCGSWPWPAAATTAAYRRPFPICRPWEVFWSSERRDWTASVDF